MSTKIVIRPLPSTLTESEFATFLSKISPKDDSISSDDVVWMYFIPGSHIKPSKNSKNLVNQRLSYSSNKNSNDNSNELYKTGCAYVKFKNQQSVNIFVKAIQGKKIISAIGNIINNNSDTTDSIISNDHRYSTTLRVEYAPNQYDPSFFAKEQKIDPLQGSIENDSDYLKFLDKLKQRDESPQSDHLSSKADVLNESVSTSSGWDISSNERKAILSTAKRGDMYDIPRNSTTPVLVSNMPSFKISGRELFYKMDRLYKIDDLSYLQFQNNDSAENSDSSESIESTESKSKLNRQKSSTPRSSQSNGNRKYKSKNRERRRERRKNKENDTSETKSQKFSHRIDATDIYSRSWRKPDSIEKEGKLVKENDNEGEENQEQAKVNEKPEEKRTKKRSERRNRNKNEARKEKSIDKEKGKENKSTSETRKEKRFEKRRENRNRSETKIRKDNEEESLNTVEGSKNDNNTSDNAEDKFNVSENNLENSKGIEQTDGSEPIIPTGPKADREGKPRSRNRNRQRRNRDSAKKSKEEGKSSIKEQKEDGKSLSIEQTEEGKNSPRKQKEEGKSSVVETKESDGHLTMETKENSNGGLAKELKEKKEKRENGSKLSKDGHRRYPKKDEGNKEGNDNKKEDTKDKKKRGMDRAKRFKGRKSTNSQNKSNIDPTKVQLLKRTTED